VTPELIWRPRARLDLIDIYLTIARNNPSAAERICAEIETKVTPLTTYPRLGVRRNDIQPGVRALVIRPYLVLYRTVPDTDDGAVDSIILIRVVDGRRHLRRLLG
jgi:toxin ParE1/3/4